MAGHFAGADLTGEFADAPHGEEVFERYPQVGVLQDEPRTPGNPGSRSPRAAAPGFWAAF